jgi:hypothetical protein
MIPKPLQRLRTKLLPSFPSASGEHPFAAVNLVVPENALATQAWRSLHDLVAVLVKKRAAT